MSKETIPTVTATVRENVSMVGPARQTHRCCPKGNQVSLFKSLI